MDATQIVLKLVLDELKQAGVEPEEFDQRLTIQKKIYLGQLTGVDIGYRFSWYRYGPYCRELTEDIFGLKQALDSRDEDYNQHSLNPTVAQRLKRAPEFSSSPPG